MNESPLEDRVHDALHRQADPIHRAPLTVTDVRGRARRIQRRRAAVAGVAVAAALAVAVPFGLGLTGQSQRGDLPPATQSPTESRTDRPTQSPTRVPGTVRIDPRSAEVVDGTPVALLDVDAPSLIAPDGTTSLPGPFTSITPYLDGWVGVQDYEGAGTIRFLDADGVVVDGGSPAGGLVVSPDGTRIAWSEYTGSRWQVVVADPTGEEGWDYTKLPASPEDHVVVPVGFVGDGRVAVRKYDDTIGVKTLVVGGGETVEVPGLMQADAASQTLGAVAGLTSTSPDRNCFAVVDAFAGTGDWLWDTCDYKLGPFSPDGAYVVGTSTEADMDGSPTLSILDATTGEPIVDFEVAGSRTQVTGIWSQMAWDGSDAVVVRVTSSNEASIARLGLDGSVQRVGVDAAGESGLSVAMPD